MADGGDADEEPRRRGDMWTNILRVDCSKIPKKDAERWLREYGDVVRIVFRRIVRGIPKTAGLDPEDVLSVGQMAVLEACVTYDPNNARKASLRTWVGILVHWRMSAVLERTKRPAGEVIDHAQAVFTQDGELVDEFEARMEATEALRQVAEVFAGLPHRTRLILLHRLEGATSGETAKSLGISVVREQQIVDRSRAVLRSALLEQPAETVTGEPAEDSISE